MWSINFSADLAQSPRRRQQNTYTRATMTEHFRFSRGALRSSSHAIKTIHKNLTEGALLASHILTWHASASCQTIIPSYWTQSEARSSISGSAVSLLKVCATGRNRPNQARRLIVMKMDPSQSHSLFTQTGLYFHRNRRRTDTKD